MSRTAVHSRSAVYRRMVRIALIALAAMALSWMGPVALAHGAIRPVPGSPAPETPGPLLRLRVGAFDPTRTTFPAPLRLPSSFPAAGRALHLVQFPGPIREVWYEAMVRAGLEIVSYIPEYAYLVWGDGEAIRRLAGAAPLRWTGDYYAGYALHPSLQSPDNQADLVSVAVQVIANAAGQATLRAVETNAARVIRPAITVRNLTTVGIEIAAYRLGELAALPAVVTVEPLMTPRLLDEMQGQLIAGQVTPDGSQPTGPGYLSWLTATVGLSVDPLDYPIVDVTDDGIDDGSATPQHPDFFEFGDTARPDRLVYNYNWTGDPAADSAGGHGNINASIVGGYNALTGFPYEDAAGYNLGLGINPFGRFAGSKVFANAGPWDAPNYPYLVSNATTLGARIISNSWGDSPGKGRYQIDDQIYDALVRDADAATPGEQPVTIIFAAGNAGPGAGTIGSPANAKNVITVGASENVRPTWTDRCGIGATDADNANDIARFSSRGPTADGRLKPELVAPGTHIQGAATQSTTYTGAFICDKYRPSGQTLYTASSGTSHSAPAVAGAASLLTHFYQTHFGPAAPSPAMIKAYLVNAARYLDGVSSGDTLPSNSQGYGALDLGMAFDETPRIVQDQEIVLHTTGESSVLQGYVPRSDVPFRVTLAWTDPPGSTVGDAYVNNLDLIVTVGGQTYLGNVFAGATSLPGGTPDTRNNVESVFLPQGVQGPFVITVTASNLAGNGVLTNDDPTDQDFALVCTNCRPYATFSLGVSPQTQTICALTSAIYTVDTAGLAGLAGFADDITLEASGLPTGATAAFEPNPVMAGNTSTLTIVLTEPSSGGYTTIQVTASGAAAVHTATVGLTILTAPTDAPALTAPPDGAAGVSLNPTLAWTAVSEATHYVIDVATDISFTQPIYRITTPTPSHSLTETLHYSTPYHWRVTAANACGHGAPSAGYAFTTLNYRLYFPLLFKPAADPPPTPAQRLN